MKRLKVIQINSSSSSFLMRDFEEDIFRNWFARVAFQEKKISPSLNIECWTLEKEFKKERIYERKNIKFRAFPSTLSVRQGMEISIPMIKALKQEIDLSRAGNYKLILHFHEYHSWQVYAILASIKKSGNLKLIAQHHGARNPFENVKVYKRLLLMLPAIMIMQIFENLFFKKIDLFYALSDRELFYIGKKASGSEARFQTMGIGEEYFTKIDKEMSRRKIGLIKGKKYILYLGRIKTTKGIGELLDAIKNIDAEMLLIGEGVDSEKYKKYAENNQIKNVRFLGAKFGEEKIDYLSACDCLVLPSYTEGAPVVLMEAIARNLPVLATNVGGISKMIQNGREGLIINPKSSWEIAKAIGEILRWKPKNIKRYSQKYKWKEIIKETIKDYGK